MFDGSVALAVVHLAVGAAWFGSMAYSLLVVQPAVARFFPDDARREELLVLLAQGNRWRVVGMVAVLLLSGIGLAVTAGAFWVVVALDAVAAAIFVDVSWRHWPARVFATVEELPRYHRALRRRAYAMVALVGTAFLLGLVLTAIGGGR